LHVGKDFVIVHEFRESRKVCDDYGFK